MLPSRLASPLVRLFLVTVAPQQSLPPLHRTMYISTSDANGQPTKKPHKSLAYSTPFSVQPLPSTPLLASWLDRLGVSQAESVTFIADGATWIWDRFDWVVATLQLPKAKVQYAMALSMQVFDF